MAAPEGEPDFGTIVIFVSMPLLYLAVFDIIHSNQAVYRRRSRTFASVNGRIDRQEEQDLRIYGHEMQFYSAGRSYCLVFWFCLHSGSYSLRRAPLERMLAYLLS
jgi:hypothetical protein